MNESQLLLNKYSRPKFSSLENTTPLVTSPSLPASKTLDQNYPICKTEKETQMYRTEFWTLGEGEGGTFQKNSIETCLLSRVKQITSPGWMHETSAQTWCTGKTQREKKKKKKQRERKKKKSSSFPFNILVLRICFLLS